MEIRFSGDPHIKFGSGNFEVSPEGHIHAVGGGDIAGWQVSDDSLSKGYVTLSSNNDEPTNKAIKVTDGDKDIFSVDYRGYLHSEQGDIAGWTIAPNKLYKGDVGIAPEIVEVEDIQHAFWASDKFYVNHDGTLHSEQGDIGGWTIAPNKLSYSTKNGNGDVLIEDKVGLSPTGNKLIWAKDGNNKQLFSVSNNGYLYAKNGEIGSWRFSDKGLYSEEKGNISSFKKDDGTIPNTGVYVGTDGIRLGSTFRVDSGGNLYTQSGLIGNIKISGDGLSGDNFDIDGAGVANFTDVIINGASVTRMMTATGSGGISGGGSSLGASGFSTPRGAISASANGSTKIDASQVIVPGGNTLKEYIEGLAEEVVTKKITANFIVTELQRVDELSADIISANTFYIGKDNHRRDLEDEINNLWKAVNLKADKT